MSSLPSLHQTTFSICSRQGDEFLTEEIQFTSLTPLIFRHWQSLLPRHSARYKHSSDLPDTIKLEDNRAKLKRDLKVWVKANVSLKG